jgi:capsular exopolysaccharide synthesis family protein
MSELFKWLSKAEAKSPGIQQAQVLKGDFGLAAAYVPDSLPDIAPTEAAVPSWTKFNLDIADPKIKAVLDSQTLPGEQFRFLRTRLAQLQHKQGLKNLLITSSVPGEGKTFISCCLAGILAQESGKRVLLVDADFRRPRTAQSLGIEIANELPGLSQVLQGSHKLEDVFLCSSNDGFFYLPAGPTPGNPSELLASYNLERAIQEISALFDWIIIDSPPVLTIADSMRMATLCDSVLMVVLANKTPSKLIQKAIQMVGKSHICGTVLNRVPIAGSSHYYYHYYTENGYRVK